MDRAEAWLYSVLRWFTTCWIWPTAAGTPVQLRTCATAPTSAFRVAALEPSSLFTAAACREAGGGCRGRGRGRDDRDPGRLAGSRPLQQDNADHGQDHDDGRRGHGQDELAAGAPHERMNGRRGAVAGRPAGAAPRSPGPGRAGAGASRIGPSRRARDQYAAGPMSLTARSARRARLRARRPGVRAAAGRRRLRPCRDRARPLASITVGRCRTRPLRRHSRPGPARRG